MIGYTRRNWQCDGIKKSMFEKEKNFYATWRLSICERNEKKQVLIKFEWIYFCDCFQVTLYGGISFLVSMYEYSGGNDEFSVVWRKKQRHNKRCHQEMPEAADSRNDANWSYQIRNTLLCRYIWIIFISIHIKIDSWGFICLWVFGIFTLSRLIYPVLYKKLQ